MSEQPPVQPQPPANPPTRPMPAHQPTQSMPAPQGAPPAGPPAPPAGTPAPPAGTPAGSASGDVPRPNVWQRATSTTGRAVALAVSAGVLVCLLFLSIGIAGIALVRNNDRFDLVGRQDGHFLGEDRPGNGRGNAYGHDKDLRDHKDLRDPKELKNDLKDHQDEQGLPGLGNQGQRHGQGGAGSLLGAAALHGELTATVDGSVQTVVFQRGEVTAVSATSITLKSSDGFAGTYGRNVTTKANGAEPVKGGDAFVLARAADKMALRLVSTPAKAGVAPNS